MGTGDRFYKYIYYKYKHFAMLGQSCGNIANISLVKVVTFSEITDCGTLLTQSPTS